MQLQLPYHDDLEQQYKEQEAFHNTVHSIINSDLQESKEQERAGWD